MEIHFYQRVSFTFYYNDDKSIKSLLVLIKATLKVIIITFSKIKGTNCNGIFVLSLLKNKK